MLGRLSSAPRGGCPASSATWRRGSPIAARRRRRRQTRCCFRNGRPLTSAMSIRRSIPAVKASSAPSRSCRTIPRSRAKWLRVPAGRQMNGRSCSAAAAATVASEPSPPAMPSASAPLSTAIAVSVARSSVGPSTTGSTPRSRARSARAARAALPSPDRGLISSTGRRGGSTRSHSSRKAPKRAGTLTTGL